MKILLIHNKYKQAGGEDVVFRMESDLLEKHGHKVEEMLFDNNEIDTWLDKLMAGIKTIYNPDSAKAIQQKIDDFVPDIIHVHNFFPLVSPAVFFVASKNKTPIVVTLHNYRLICPSATLFYNGRIYEKNIDKIFPLDAVVKGVYHKSIFQTLAVAFMLSIHNLIGTWRNKVSFYIALTNFSKGKFESSSLSIPSERILVKPNFVEEVVGGELEREDFFLYVGRLTEEKGVHILLQAAKNFPFELVIIGDGPLRDWVEKSTDDNANVRYLGFQNKEVILHYLKTCKALIFPSIWYEGFPMTILEAFSTATPVVASDIGAISEIIQNRVNGLHFEAGNFNDLIDKIIEISENPPLAKKIGETSYSIYQKKFTPEVNYNALLTIYELAIGNLIKDSSAHLHDPVSIADEVLY